MISCYNVVKEFGDPPQRILHGLTFDINDGDFVAISGRSGSGKSTLLYLISTLDDISSGKIEINNRDMKSYSSDEIHEFRNRHVGFIFQFHYLLPELTALENVLLPARNLNLDTEKKPEAIELLKSLNIEAQKDKFPAQMSGGEQQRVAIARSLIMNPRYIFADEPTGNLDTHNSHVVMELLKSVNKLKKTTICLVTHEPSFAAMAEREIYLVDGKIDYKKSRALLK